jgi:hypothetical protein
MLPMELVSHFSSSNPGGVSGGEEDDLTMELLELRCHHSGGHNSGAALSRVLVQGPNNIALLSSHGIRRLSLVGNNNDVR